MPFTRNKLIISGSSVHHYKYSKPIQYGYSVSKRRQKRNRGFKSQDTIEKTAFRAVKNFRLLLQSNAELSFNAPSLESRIVFVTLTFSDNVTDIELANREFTKFIKRANKVLSIKLKYIAVPEIQKRREAATGFGVWHYHLVIFNFPKLSDDNTHAFITRVWGHGFTHNTTVRTFFKLQNYLSKYFLKTFSDDSQYNKKRYFRSRNLIKPRVYHDNDNNQIILDIIQDQPLFKQQYIDRYGDKVIYTLYTNQLIASIL